MGPGPGLTFDQTGHLGGASDCERLALLALRALALGGTQLGAEARHLLAVLPLAEEAVPEAVRAGRVAHVLLFRPLDRGLGVRIGHGRIRLLLVPEVPELGEVRAVVERRTARAHDLPRASAEEADEGARVDDLTVLLDHALLVEERDPDRRELHRLGLVLPAGLLLLEADGALHELLGRRRVDARELQVLLLRQGRADLLRQRAQAVPQHGRRGQLGAPVLLDDLALPVAFGDLGPGEDLLEAAAVRHAGGVQLVGFRRQDLHLRRGFAHCVHSPMGYRL